MHDYAGSGVDFEALAIIEPGAASGQRWYAFPELRPDEVVAFRTYDSDLVADASTYFTPHSAFRDAEVEIGRPARQSIELPRHLPLLLRARRADRVDRGRLLQRVGEAGSLP